MTALYVVAVFLSAFLLFLVQPIAGKTLTPVLGGSPSVWNTSMVFFQAVLLAGYGAAHLTARWLSPGWQAASHLGLFALSLAAWPLAIGAEAPRDEAGSPIPWLLTRLALGVGLPFLALAATGPSLQRWLHHTRHPLRGDPYFLYAASNVGSMAALLGYPVAVEPVLALGRQMGLWSALYLLLIVLLVACGLWMRRDLAPAAAEPAAAPEPIALRRRLRWLILAFVPSSLLLGATTAITTDIAAVPLLWVVPLAIYLLSFVLVFARRPVLYETSVTALRPAILLVSMTFLFESLSDSLAFIVVHLGVLFLAAMVCHGQLALDRPPPRHLTQFYLWLSLGGVLGGAFNALLAPVLFDRMWEYGLALVLACLLVPARGGTRLRSWRKLAPALLVIAALALLATAGTFLLVDSPAFGAALQRAALALGDLGTGYHFDSRSLVFFAVALLTAAASLFFLWHGPGFALVMAFVVVLGVGRPLLRYNERFFDRNFFGLLRVEDVQGLRFIVHGTTVHGIQRLQPGRRLVPTSYYHASGPIHRLVGALNRAGRLRDAAVVGLGAGVMSCLLEEGQSVTFYEIDPAVARVAMDPTLFTFLRDCPPSSEIVLGDARLSLEDAPDDAFDLIVLDAFSSDAIPVHLLTREAAALYLQKLRRGGVLVFNASNRTLDVRPVLAALARDHGLVAIARADASPSRDAAKLPSEWVAMARRRADLAPIRRADRRWAPLVAAPDTKAWTDDFSSLLPLLR